MTFPPNGASLSGERKKRTIDLKWKVVDKSFDYFLELSRKKDQKPYAVIPVQGGVYPLEIDHRSSETETLSGGIAFFFSGTTLLTMTSLTGLVSITGGASV